MSELRAGSATDVGRVRSVNQDMVLDRPNLYAVADGMGGHAGGEVAARLAVETLEAAFGRWPTSVGLREAVEEANVAVWRESQVHPDLHGMGTTLTALAVVDESGGQATLALANVGDSRAYLFSRGALTQITFDHSLAEERVRLGEMTEAEAAVHPQRHILTRALGVSADVQVDVWELGAPRGTRVLLCSDGLSNEVGPEEIAAILERETDPAEAARSLVEVANEHGGADNITVVVVDVLSGDETSSAGIVLVPAVEATGDTVPPPPPPAPRAPAVPSRPLRPDDTLALGTHLEFGPGTSTLTEAEPRSDEFFVGAPGSMPLSRSSTRVPPPPPLPPTTTRAPEKETRGERRRRLGITRRVTPRVIGFLLLVAAVPVAAYYVLRWYAYDNWIVVLQGNQVVVTQGQPGGVLWFHPRVVDRTGITRSQVTPTAVVPLKAGVQKSSLHDAQQYVANITMSSAPTGSVTTTTTQPKPTSGTSATTTTTTTAP